MAGEWTELLEGLDMLGELFEGIANSPYAMYFIVLIVFTVLFWNILRALLSKVPMFAGDGDQKVNTYGNITAWCISILAILSIGWNMRGQSVDAVVNALAGPQGVFMVMILGLVLGYSLYKGFEGYKKAVRVAIALFGSGTIYVWLLGYTQRSTGYLQMYWLLSIIAFIVGIVLHFKGRDD